MKRLFCLLLLTSSIALVNDLQAMEQLNARTIEDLFEACRADEKEKVKTLLAQNIDVNAVDKYLNTALHYAAMVGSEVIVAALIANRAAVDVRNVYDQTPLHYATEQGREAVVALLLATKKS